MKKGGNSPRRLAFRSIFRLRACHMTQHAERRLLPVCRATEVNCDSAVIALWLGHESSETTLIYLHADMRLKERALAHANVSGVAPTRYKPPDPLLAFLEGL